MKSPAKSVKLASEKPRICARHRIPQSHASVACLSQPHRRRAAPPLQHRLPPLSPTTLPTDPMPAGPLRARARVCVEASRPSFSAVSLVPPTYKLQPFARICRAANTLTLEKISAWKVGSPLLLKPPPDRGERPGSRGRIGSLFDCSQQPACVSSTLPLPNHLCLAQQPAQEWWSHLGTERESRRLARAQGRRRHAPVAAAH